MEQQETPLPADWAIQAAIDRVDGRFVDGNPWTLAHIKDGKIYGFKRWVVELARMIEKHEEAPDPLAADREFVAAMEDATGATVAYSQFWRSGGRDDRVRKVMAYLRANVGKITGSA